MSSQIALTTPQGRDSTPTPVYRQAYREKIPDVIQKIPDLDPTQLIPNFITVISKTIQCMLLRQIQWFWTEDPNSWLLNLYVNAHGKCLACNLNYDLFSHHHSSKSNCCSETLTITYFCSSTLRVTKVSIINNQCCFLNGIYLGLFQHF